jgi:RNA polymerase sigma-70 factor (ECF subfamily)
MDDQEIIKRILSGDKAAMRNLIDKYQELVVNTCYQVLHCREDAEDVAQEVFLQAYRSLASLRHVECLSFWLYRISLNKSINHYNQNRFIRKILRLDTASHATLCDELLRGDAKNNSHADQDDDSKKLEIIWHFIDLLPARQRKAFILHHYEGLPYHDIAQILNTSLASVESLIFRAKTTLKGKCMAYYEGKGNYKH